MNVVSPFDKKQEFNLNADDAVNLVKRVNPKLTIITHFGKDMLEANPTYIAREMTRLTDCEVIAAQDGLVVDPALYGSNTRQEKDWCAARLFKRGN